MNKSFKIDIIIFLLVFVGFLFMGCSSKEPVRLGFLGQLTGTASEWGRGARDGANLSIDIINEQGGVKNRQIELVVKNSNEYEDITDALMEFSNDGIDIIIGCVLSTNSLKATPFANSKNMLLLSPTSSTRDLGEIDDNFIRCVQNDKQIAYRLAEYLSGTGKWRKVNSAWSMFNRTNMEGWHNSFKEKMEENGNIVEVKGTFEGESDFKQLALSLIAGDPDGIFIVGQLDNANKLIQELYKLKTDIPIAINSGSTLKESPSVFGNAGENIIGVQAFFMDMDNSKHMDFYNLFTENYTEEPNYPNLLGYDAGNIMIRALRETNDITPESLKETILRIKGFDSPMGTVIIDKYGDSQRDVNILQIKNGEYVKIN